MSLQWRQFPQSGAWQAWGENQSIQETYDTIVSQWVFHLIGKGLNDNLVTGAEQIITLIPALII